MADTRIQLEVEDWVRRNWMQKQFGTRFSRERVRLHPGGVFDFDAVSDDGSIIATISTSGSRTAGGKNAVGKMLKLNSDMLYLTMAVGTKRRIVVLTEEDMYKKCMEVKHAGRTPGEIELVCAKLPVQLRERLVYARQLASKEISVNAGADWTTGD